MRKFVARQMVAGRNSDTGGGKHVLEKRSQHLGCLGTHISRDSVVLGPKWVAMARYGLPMGGNESYGFWEASGAPPGPLGGHKKLKTRENQEIWNSGVGGMGKARRIRRTPAGGCKACWESEWEFFLDRPRPCRRPLHFAIICSVLA